jgi:hypothetical protein
MNFKIIFAAAALLATQSFAIAGIGGHYAPNVGTSLKKVEKANIFKDNSNLQFSHGDFSGLQGFGFKAWVDILPFIDVEGTFNIQFASYNASLWAKAPNSDTYKEIPMEIELGGTPFAKATPKYIAMNADISVTYPFSIPLFPIRPYVGGGLTMHWNTFVLNKPFVTKVIKDAYGSDVDVDNIDPKKLAEKVIDYAKDEGLTKSVGIHLLAGVRFKLPIIPIAAYANVKCYLGGDYDDDIDAGHFAFELGGGFAL